MTISKVFEKKVIMYPLTIAGYLFAMVGGFLLIGADVIEVIKWEAALFALSMMALPIVSSILKAFGNKAYVTGRVVGLCILSYVVFMLTALKLVGYSSLLVILSLILTALIIYLIYYFFIYKKQENSIGLFECMGVKARDILQFELLFLVITVAAVWWFGHTIPGTDTERLMDYAFMVSVDKSTYLPPLDSWAALDTINYYYYGQYMCALLGRLASVNMANAYSLSMATIFSITLVFSYVIVETLLRLSKVSRGKRIAGGIFSSLLVGVAGNGHYIVFYKIMPALFDMLRLDVEKKGYWFADSTRYIGYTPVNEADRTIEEFPSYSFLVGDLHAHVIDIMVVLTLIIFITNYAVCRIREYKNNENMQLSNSLLRELFNPNLIICIFFISIASMSNFWDYAIYYVVCGAVVLTVYLCIYGCSLKTLWLTLLQGAWFFVAINIFNFVFMGQFEAMFDGIGKVTIRSYLHQLTVLWGLPIACVIVYVLWLTKAKKWSDELSDNLNNCQDKGLVRFIRCFEISDVLIMVFSLCAVGLVITPEVIFVKDIYINGFPRANTMFKLSYEAFILFGLSMGYIITRILSCKAKDDIGVRAYVDLKALKRIIFVLGLFCIWTMGYFVTASRQRMGEFGDFEYKGINSISTIVDEMGADSMAYDFIINNINDNSTILVADGSSYTGNCVMPALTGHPTVIGWMTHEWLWHNSIDYVTERQNDVRAIYEARNNEDANALIDKYGIKYIYIGGKEYQQYDMDLNILLNLGDVVYFDTVNYYYLVEINR